MSPPAISLRDRIRQSAAGSGITGLRDLIGSAIVKTGRRARKETVKEVNDALLESALEYNRPELIALFPEIPRDELRPLFSTLLDQYIKTREEPWFSAITEIIKGLEKKGDQSQELSHLSRILIEAGSSQSDPFLISRGMTLFSGITFRKYRSEIFSRISPLLIEWAVQRQDVEFLQSLYAMTDDITDVSKRSVIHAELAVAIATIGIATGNFSTVVQSFLTAAGIRQKTRRQTCFTTIARDAAKSPLYSRVRDISATLALLPDPDREILQEIGEALLWQVIQKEQERGEVAGIVATLAKSRPEFRPVIVTSLLRRAEQNGDPWYFRKALDLQALVVGDEYPTREFVRSALAVVRATGSTEVLRQIVPAVIVSSPRDVASRILLRIVEVLLFQGKLSDAIAVFTLVDVKEKAPHYDECITDIWKYAIAADKVAEVERVFVQPSRGPEWSAALFRAVSDICRQHAFSEIAREADPLARVMALYPRHDQLVRDCIALLIRRGFLETADPDVLIRLTRSIEDLNLREQALSTIVIHVARQGAKTRNRDLLQRAVGLACAIADDRIRSLTLASTIDEATMLAVADGDLDLLRRMREWSGSLLPKDGANTALAKIIDGIIIYASGHSNPAALEEAYRFAREISDPALRKEVTNRIAENYVRIGCLQMQDLIDSPSGEEFGAAFRLFERALAILTADPGQDTASLKIAYNIDIILDSFKSRVRIDMVLPLVLFVLELREGYERDAMAARIAPLLRSLSGQTESTDPYEGIADVLLRIRYLPQNPVLLDLVVKTVHQIKDPFIRSLQLMRVSDLYYRSGKTGQARTLLDETCAASRQVDGEYRQVILLAGCITRLASFDEEAARRILHRAIDILRSTGYDPDAAARSSLIRAIVKIHQKNPDPGLVEIAQQIGGDIAAPAEFVPVMIPIYRMVAGDPEFRAAILNRVRTAADAIPVAIYRASLLLELAGQMAEDRDFSGAGPVLDQILAVTGSIPVPHLADSIRLKVAESWIRIADATGDGKCYTKASGIIAGIGHEDIQAATTGLPGNVQEAPLSPQFTEITERAGQLVTERYNPQQLNTIETMIRSLPERGLVSRYFCMTGILFNRAGRVRLARRFYEAAVSEARIIRPLSRRAYVLCDLSLVLDRGGCGTWAQETMGYAVDAATGIRQFREREEVFDNLAAAVRWMQEERTA